MSWISFIMYMASLYFVYYTSIILYDLYIKKDRVSKGEKVKKLIIFEEHSPKKIDEVETKEREEKTIKPIKEKKEVFSFMDFQGSPNQSEEEEEEEEEEEKEIGIGGLDLKTLQKRAKLIAKQKLTKVKFEEAII